MSNIKPNMKKCVLVLAISLFMASLANADGQKNKAKNIELYFNGVPQVNTDPLPQAFEEACAGNICTPSTTIHMVDPVTNQFAATLHVWTKNNIASPDKVTFCFTELIEYKLLRGTIYTIANPDGTCGAATDPNFIVPPIPQAGAYVVAGGGAGNIVGGTGDYKKLQGTYIDRVFVELSSTGQILYYSGLFFNLMTKGCNK